MIWPPLHRKVKSHPEAGYGKNIPPALIIPAKNLIFKGVGRSYPTTMIRDIRHAIHKHLRALLSGCLLLLPAAVPAQSPLRDYVRDFRVETMDEGHAICWKTNIADPSVAFILEQAGEDLQFGWLTNGEIRRPEQWERDENGMLVNPHDFDYRIEVAEPDKPVTYYRLLIWRIGQGTVITDTLSSDSAFIPFTPELLFVRKNAEKEMLEIGLQLQNGHITDVEFKDHPADKMIFRGENGSFRISVPLPGLKGWGAKNPLRILFMDQNGIVRSLSVVQSTE